MGKIKINDLKNFIKELSKQELENELVDLVKKYSNVNEYYNFKANKNTDELFNKYKKEIESQFFTKDGIPGEPSTREIKNLISEYKKIDNDVRRVIELKILYVNSAIDYMNMYGDLWESFYTQTENAFDSILKDIAKNDLYDEYFEKITTIYKKSRGHGWGFSDYMEELYFDIYGDRV